jgi:hypothetical protein
MATESEQSPQPFTPDLDPYAAAWSEVERNWGDDTAHRKFIAFCAAQGALDQAGRRYRLVRDSDPTRKSEAARRIDAVLATALQTMDLARSERPTRGSRLQWVAFGVSAFFLLYALLSVLRARPH